MFNLEGKTALVTGASGGIGQAIVASLHRQGATVIMSGTKVDTLKKIADNLKERIHFVVADLSHGSDVENLVKNAEIALGKEVDILVNNAGITKDNLSAFKNTLAFLLASSISILFTLAGVKLLWI